MYQMKNNHPNDKRALIFRWRMWNRFICHVKKINFGEFMLQKLSVITKNEGKGVWSCQNK